MLRVFGMGQRPARAQPRCRIAAKPRGPDIGVLCLEPGQLTRWGAGRFRTGDARLGAGAGDREDGAGPMSHPSEIYAINAPIRPAHPEIVPGGSPAKRAEFGVRIFFSGARARH